MRVHIDETRLYALLFVIAAAVVLILVSVAIVISRHARGQSTVQQSDETAEDDEEYPDDSEPFVDDLPTANAVSATVTNKSFERVHTGSHLTPDFCLVYFVEFLIFNRETVTHAVPREIYEAVEIGQSGTLVTVEGEFFAFELNEDDTEKHDRQASDGIYY